MIVFRIILFTLILIVLSLGRSEAQNEDSAPIENKVKIGHGLGFAAGTTSGYGLSYRIFFNRLGIFLTYAPYQNEEESTYVLGYGFLLNLVEGEKAIFFLYQSNVLIKQGGTADNAGTYSNHGLGLGIELIIAKAVGFNLMGGFGIYEQSAIIPVTIDVGLYYKF